MHAHFHRFILRPLVLGVACGLVAGSALAQERAADTARIDRWNLTELKRAPAMRWISQDGPIHSLQYAGEEFDGHDTEVFAFYASPITVGDAATDAGQKFPGVVLIHGGGGTAFAEWTWLWARRGYAAIAMDLSGSRPIPPLYDDAGVPVANQAGKQDTRTRLSNGGPSHGHGEKFDSIGGDVSDDWPYHAVANVVRAHSLLRSFREVRRSHRGDRDQLGRIHDVPGRLGRRSLPSSRACLRLWFSVRGRISAEAIDRQAG